MKTRSIEGIIFDWAGTTVDYGCFAPLDVFCTIFANNGVPVTVDEAREPMGMLKWDHIKAMLSQTRIGEEWKRVHGNGPTDSDVDQLYAEFEPALFSILPGYAEPIPGVVETIKTLREKGLKIGSTTGYTREMIDIVSKEAAKRGYAPDSIVTSDECRDGRPAPWMIYHNCELLNLQSLECVVKVGDTKSDILEGVNASVWSVGVIEGSSWLGMDITSFENLSAEEQVVRTTAVRKAMFETGAHFVVNRFEELPHCIEKINAVLADDVTPLHCNGIEN